MCYMLDMITHKNISKLEIQQYSKEYNISIYDKTSEIINVETNKHYYALTCGGCACGFHQKKTYEAYILLDLLEDCIEYGEVVLFFYNDNGDYIYIQNDVHMYIHYTKKIEITFNCFRNTFFTNEFIYDDTVYIIKK